jgi:hypothetical protein
MHGHFRETQPSSFERPPQQGLSVMDRNRQQEFRKTALGIAYAFLGSAANTLATQSPPRFEGISPELYNQVAAEIEAHGNISNNNKAKIESHRAKQELEKTYRNDILRWNHNNHNNEISRYNVPIDLQRALHRDLRSMPIEGPHLIRTDFTFRDAPLAVLWNQDRNAPGVHLTHSQYPECEVYIPHEVLTLNGIYYTHIADIKNRLNLRVTDSVDNRMIRTLLHHLRDRGTANTLGEWNVRVVRPFHNGESPSQR